MPPRLGAPAGAAQPRPRASQRERGYTRRWERLARWFLARWSLCGDRPHGLPPVMSLCREQGRTTPATQVDHVVPHKGDPVLMWDWEGNMQALCASCGGRKSARGL